MIKRGGRAGISFFGGLLLEEAAVGDLMHSLLRFFKADFENYRTVKMPTTVQSPLLPAIKEILSPNVERYHD